MFTDKKIICTNCGLEFVFSQDEQKFYNEKNLKNEPSFCRNCRNKQKEKRKKLFSAVCSKCGCETKVPFIPDEKRPVYCKECFLGM